jgi:hypothetical protein
MNWRRVLSVIRKEWWHITRDRTSFVLLLLSPVLALVTMAYAFSIDIKDVGIGVLNQDLSPLSRQYLAQTGQHRRAARGGLAAKPGRGRAAADARFGQGGGYHPAHLCSEPGLAKKVKWRERLKLTWRLKTMRC